MNINLQSLLKRLFYPSLTSNEDGTNIIREEIQGNTPSMIARFGANEIKAVLFPLLPSIVKPFVRKRIFSKMQDSAGFFPMKEDAIEKFSRMMVDDMQLLDILGSWRIEERLLAKHFPESKNVDLKTLEPYLSENPWSEFLEGRKVLVVHPFSSTIENQYHENRTKLFADARVLPQFKSLKAIKAVQTIAGCESEFPDWFAALDSMKSVIDSKDYDIAIIGCGAYGFPLAAHVKRQGKKAIHMGGATQLLFGIKGQRWDTHPVISQLYNEHWVRPSPEDRPKGAEKVENGCYW